MGLVPVSVFRNELKCPYFESPEAHFGFEKWRKTSLLAFFHPLDVVFCIGSAKFRSLNAPLLSK